MLFGGMNMKINLKRILIFSGLAIAFIIGLILAILNLREVDNTDPEVVASYCARNPQALMCGEDSYTYEELAVDLFEDLREKYTTDYESLFCYDHFYGKISQYCVQSKENVMPTNTSRIADDYEIVEISSGIFNFVTYDKFTHQDLWTFRVAVVKHLGVYLISGLSYFETPDPVDLELSDADINTYMTTMIEASDDGDSDFCESYFTGTALVECESSIITVIPQADLLYNYEVSNFDINEFNYSVTDELSTVEYTFTVFFVKIDDNIYIKEITTTNTTE